MQNIEMFLWQHNQTTRRTDLVERKIRLNIWETTKINETVEKKKINEYINWTGSYQSKTLRLSEDIQVLKETTTKFSSKLIGNELVTLASETLSIDITYQEIFARSDHIFWKLQEELN